MMGGDGIEPKFLIFVANKLSLSSLSIKNSFMLGNPRIICRILALIREEFGINGPA